MCCWCSGDDDEDADHDDGDSGDGVEDHGDEENGDGDGDDDDDTADLSKNKLWLLSRQLAMGMGSFTALGLTHPSDSPWKAPEPWNT